MEFIVTEKYVGEGFKNLEILRVSQISRIQIFSKQNRIAITCAGDSIDVKISQSLIETLKNVGLLPTNFDFKQLTLNESELRERLTKLEKSSNK